MDALFAKRVAPQETGDYTGIQKSSGEVALAASPGW